MSTPTQRDNLARIRDNQRRSRARRKEYLQELEQRLRVCELQGIEASAEVQMAARRVAQENRKLRELLNICGVSDVEISHYLQSGTVGPPPSVQGHPFRVGDPGAAAQSLQQVLLPRPPVFLTQGVSHPLPRQSSQETSTAGGSTPGSVVWESTQATAPLYGRQQQIGVASTAMASSAHARYPPAAFVGSNVPTRPEALVDPPPSSSILNHLGQPMVPGQSMPMDNRPAAHYHYSMPPYQDPEARNYDASGGGC